MPIQKIRNKAIFKLVGDRGDAECEVKVDHVNITPGTGLTRPRITGFALETPRVHSGTPLMKTYNPYFIVDTGDLDTKVSFEKDQKYMYNGSDFFSSK